MQKKPLKVQPARRIYKPKYPSFEDKNPLVHPETRPYPFSHKFIKWASTGGLASFLLLSGNELSGQAPADTLHNPFPLENAQVPYRPVSFGTGLPERLKSEEAVQAIRKAFAESGIQLEEHVWLEGENIGVYLDGYSRKDKIGFLFMDYANMDTSFTIGSYPQRSYLETEAAMNGKYDLQYNVKQSVERRAEEFRRFLEDKAAYIEELTRYRPTALERAYADQLSELAPREESEERFNTCHLQYSLDAYRQGIKEEEGLHVDISRHIDSRFEDSVEKRILWSYIHSLRRHAYYTDEFYGKVSAAVSQLKSIGPNKDFIERYLALIEFLNYNNGSYLLHKDTAYQELKLGIMKAYPPEQWLDNLEPLDACHDRNFVSLSEARRIDEKNEDGTQFIAPISLRDPVMIIHNGNLSEDLQKEGKLLQEERNRLWEEYSRENGMTKEILAQRQAEMKALFEQYAWNKLKDLPRQERDSLNNRQKEERKAIEAKYEAMELLTQEEKAAYRLKFKALDDREQAWQKACTEDIRLNTLRKLEEQVRMYIKWARSQMGG